MHGKIREKSIFVRTARCQRQEWPGPQLLFLRQTYLSQRVHLTIWQFHLYIRMKHHIFETYFARNLEQEFVYS